MFGTSPLRFIVFIFLFISLLFLDSTNPGISVSGEEICPEKGGPIPKKEPASPEKQTPPETPPCPETPSSPETPTPSYPRTKPRTTDESPYPESGYEKLPPTRERPKEPPEGPSVPPETPEPIGEFTCKCKFDGYAWIPWETIAGEYVLLPNPSWGGVKLPAHNAKIPLKVMGKDVDLLELRSIETYPTGKVICRGKKYLTSQELVVYKWKIQGKGTFSNGKREDEMESVIYLPPHLNPGEEVIEKIETFVDDRGGKGDDAANKGEIHLKITRSGYPEDFQYITVKVIERIDFKPVEKVPIPKVEPCECSISYEWLPGKELIGGIKKIPNPMCVGDRYLFEAAGGDLDDLKVDVSSPRCGGETKIIKNIADVMKYEGWWANLEKIDGAFLGGKIGQRVIYQTPEKLLGSSQPDPNEEIKMKADDLEKNQFDDKDKKDKQKAKVTQVDLDIERYDHVDVPEKDEETEGAVLCLNCDDDNKNDEEDLNDKKIREENDLLKLKILKVNPGKPEAEVQLLIEEGGDKIRLWEHPDKYGKPVRSGTKYKNKDLLKTLWVEGVKGSESRNDVKITLKELGPQAACGDTVRLSVVTLEVKEVKDLWGNDLTRPGSRYVLGDPDMRILYEVAPMGISLDKDALSLEIFSKDRGERVFRVEIAPGMDIVMWNGVWNQRPFVGAYANPREGPHEIFIKAVIDNHDCEGKTKRVQTTLQVEAAVSDDPEPEHHAVISGLADLDKTVKVGFEGPDRKVNGKEFPPTAVQKIKEYKRRVKFHNSIFDDLEDGKYKIKILNVRDLVGNFYDKDPTTKEIEPLTSEVEIR